MLSDDAPMTAFEICKSYEQALYKREQIDVLAQLNLCGKNDIIETLRLNGYEIENKPRRKTYTITSTQHRWTPAEVELLIEADRDGMSYADIAKLVGVDRGTAARKLYNLSAAGKVKARRKYTKHGH